MIANRGTKDKDIQTGMIMEEDVENGEDFQSENSGDEGMWSKKNKEQQTEESD